MQALAKCYHFDYFHFLQPNQYVPHSKQFSDEENKKFYIPDYGFSELIESGYNKLEEGIATAQAQGEAAYSLTGIYRNETRTVYTDDCCHVNTLGNEIMAGAIGNAVSEYYQHKKTSGTVAGGLGNKP